MLLITCETHNPLKAHSQQCPCYLITMSSLLQTLLLLNTPWRARHFNSSTEQLLCMFLLLDTDTSVAIRYLQTNYNQDCWPIAYSSFFHFNHHTFMMCGWLECKIFSVFVRWLSCRSMTLFVFAEFGTVRTYCSWDEFFMLWQRELRLLVAFSECVLSSGRTSLRFHPRGISWPRFFTPMWVTRERSVSTCWRGTGRQSSASDTSYL